MSANVWVRVCVCEKTTLSLRLVLWLGTAFDLWLNFNQPHSAREIHGQSQSEQIRLWQIQDIRKHVYVWGVGCGVCGYAVGWCQCGTAIKARTTARCPSNSISFCTDIAALQINFKCCNFHICQRQRTKVCNAQFPLQACTMPKGRGMRWCMAWVGTGGGGGGGGDGGAAVAAAAAGEEHLLQVFHFILLCAFNGQQMKSLWYAQKKTKTSLIISS